MKRFLFLVITSTLLTSSMSHGQDAATLDTNDEVRQAARLSLAQGVNWLKQKAETDPDGWIIGPVRFYEAIGITNKIIRYSMKTVWIPVFAYTNAVVFVQDTEGAPPRKVVQQKIVKQIASNAVEKLVKDSKGTILKDTPVPIYDLNRNIRWASTGIGDEAMAAYALQKAGVPASDPILQKVLSNIEDHIATYGLPDQTWNLAWLTVVFAGTPGDEAKDLTQRLASRLLDGQITEGDARGFWGPISVHHGMLAAMVRDYLAMYSDLQKKELTLKEKIGRTSQPGKPTSVNKAAQAAVDDLRVVIARIKSLTETEICQRGFRLYDVESNWVVDPNANPKIMLPGSDHMLYNQTVADMESTQIALFALSIASEKGRLPSESLRPKAVRLPGGTSSPLPPPERTDAVLGRAATALRAQQTKDGRWSECNQHQPVTKFDAFKSTLPVPSDLKTFISLPSTVNALSTAQGIAALDDIGTMTGMQRLLTGFKAPYLAGLSASRKEIETRLAAVWLRPTVRPQFKREDYDLFRVLSHPLSGLTEAGAELQDNSNLIRSLVLAANPTGSWGKAIYSWTMPSSSRARLEAFKTASREMTKAHIIVANSANLSLSPLTRDSEAVSTAQAVLYLASTLENPATVLEELGALPELNTLRFQAVQRLMERKKTKPTPPVAKPLPIEENADELPLPTESSNTPPVTAE